MFTVLCSHITPGQYERDIREMTGRSHSTESAARKQADKLGVRHSVGTVIVVEVPKGRKATDLTFGDPTLRVVRTVTSLDRAAALAIVAARRCVHAFSGGDGVSCYVWVNHRLLSSENSIRIEGLEAEIRKLPGVFECHINLD